ncbi:MAG TPA: YceI family protein [Bacteroidota bacterium]
MKLLLFAFFTFSSGIHDADTVWKIDPSNSSIVFRVSHMMISEAVGRFREFSGSLTHNKEDFSDATVEVSISAKSITTDNSDRDDHLRSGEFFHANQYPAIIFKSTSFKKIGKDTYEIQGDLTMRGQTRPVVFTGRITGIYSTARGSSMGFKATTTIDRYDFGLRWNMILEGGGLNVGREVEIEARFELHRQ